MFVNGDARVIVVTFCIERWRLSMTSGRHVLQEQSALAEFYCIERESGRERESVRARARVCVCR